ncbi:hypothetical protein [Pleurocapsa sp. FMAR1]|uniref:hypothetical protein n=1 Tax=Pleurocapsa sp. FMAR1 TaxID=3040204 RepID=UPI0029C83D8F|nr:hypothetical protein [Pleurocapsa sp. FMAR1]
MATLLSTHSAKHYQTDQQVKYLHLEAEVDILLQKLTALQKQQLLKKLSTKSSESSELNAG